MLKPFHLSFVVPDKESAKHFYIDTLGCQVGRDNEGWFDIIFFGHQITIHQATNSMPSKKIDHFGPVLEKEQWVAVAEQLKSAGIEFIAEPFIQTDTRGRESGKYLVNDPSGNIIEFKFYDNFDKTVDDKD